MKRKSVVLLAALLASVSCLCVAEERVHSAESGYSLAFPDGWSVERDSLGADIVATLETGGAPLVANALTEPLPDGMSLEEYFAVSTELLALFLPEYKEHARGRETLSGCPALWLIYSWGTDESKIINLTYVLVQSGLGYVLSFTALAEDFDAALPIFRSIAASFRLDATREDEHLEIEISPRGPVEPESPRPAVPATTTNTFSVAVEQDGRRVEIINHEARLKKAPFALLFTFAGPDEIMVNVSEFPYSFELAAAGSPLAELPGFVSFTAVEGLFNANQEVYLSDTAPQYWFYSIPSLHRFDEIEETGDGVICRRTVAAVYLEEKRNSVPIEKYHGEALYFVFIKAARPYPSLPDREFHREYLKIAFIE